MNNTKIKSGQSIMVRDSDGRFVKGNQEGRKFPKGYAGKPKGAKNRRSVAAMEFADDVLHLNHETGKRMTYKELCMYIKKKADTSPRILNLLLDHRFGKPVEQVQHRVVPTFVIVDNKEPKDDAEEAEVIDGEQFKLPEGD